MSANLDANAYADLRAVLARRHDPDSWYPAVLHDAEGSYAPIPVSERLVQCIWYDQRLRTATLQTIDGSPVKVIFQGWWNLEQGPDFKHATVLIGTQPPTTGSVEIHLRADDWFHHGHHTDPIYNNVVLHVALWRAGSERAPRTAAGREIPQLVLEDQLDSSLELLHDEIDLEAYPHNAADHGGRCSQIISELPEDSVRALLDQAGKERFAAKTRRYGRWIQRGGDDQAFYQAWMEALGYKANKAAFRTLAQRLPLAELREHKHAAGPLLFGVANFLPVKASRDPYTRQLWSGWWKLRPSFVDQVMSSAMWHVSGSRPANHPHRRLGAAVAIIRKHPDLLGKTLGALESDGDPLKLFGNVRDAYWNHHFTLGGKRYALEGELIGPHRRRDILINVILPFAAAYAREHDDRSLGINAEECYGVLRPAMSNSIVRLAGQQLFKTPAAGRKLIRTARQQQGLIQIFQDFCLSDKSGCEHCLFPELARRWPHSPAGRNQRAPCR